jgi:putative ABC transport system substrate-binding protein
MWVGHIPYFLHQARSDSKAKNDALGGVSMISRRQLLIALGAGSFTISLASVAQQPGKVWRVGFLSARNRPASIDADDFGAFPKGMRELGYVEGKNLVIEWRFAEGKVERLPGLAAELVQLRVDVIVTQSTPATSAAQKATTTIPIVMSTVGDPIGSGFIKSLPRPGGNITGLANMIIELSPKHLEMLSSMVPKLSRVAVLLNPDNGSNPATLKTVQAAAQKLNIKILPFEARTPQEIENAFSGITREHAGAVILAQDSVFVGQRRRIAELALKNRLPSIAATRDFAESGFLIAYGTSFADLFRRTATHVDKIFKGATPADLPVEQPTTFELVINGKTAKALGLKIPQSLLVSADKVIE